MLALPAGGLVRRLVVSGEDLVATAALAVRERVRVKAVLALIELDQLRIVQRSLCQF